MDKQIDAIEPMEPESPSEDKEEQSSSSSSKSSSSSSNSDSKSTSEKKIKEEELDEVSLGTDEDKEWVSPYTGCLRKLDEFFSISKLKSNFKTEIFAGVSTFLAMCYILTVNPNQVLILGGVNDVKWPSVFIGTALGAIVGTLLMALIGKMPLALASGMGLNSAVGTLIAGFTGIEISYANSMFIVFLSAILFLLMTVIPVGRSPKTGKLVNLREKIFDSIPPGLRGAIPVGIGLFIAFIGFQGSGFIVGNKYTLCQLVNFRVWHLGNKACGGIVFMIGIILIAILNELHVSGAIMIGILVATIIGIPLEVTKIKTITGNYTPGITWKFWHSFERYFNMKPEEGGAFLACFSEGTKLPSGSALTVVMDMIVFCMIDMFDSMGTIVGCTTRAGLIDEDGKPLNFNTAMVVDAVGTTAGALLGTSSVTTFVESGAGIAEGGKTGFTALTVAILFFLSIFLLPIFACVPGAATACALVYVGVLMMGTVKNVDFSDARIAVPAFLTIVCMPLCYSITDGIGMGFFFFTIIAFIDYIIKLCIYACKNKKDKKNKKPEWPISIVMFVVFVLFVVYFFVPRTENEKQQKPPEYEK